MSLANITSRRLRVLIGPDEQDWSLAVGGFGVGLSALDESGLLPIRGQLEILPVLSAPESIDPAENPTRWHPGQPVRIQVPNQSGAWVDHPQGRLFILEEPDLPEEQGGILLQLGGRLAWHDSFEFDDDQTGVTVGTATNCARATASGPNRAAAAAAGNCETAERRRTASATRRTRRRGAAITDSDANGRIKR